MSDPAGTEPRGSHPSAAPPEPAVGPHDLLHRLMTDTVDPDYAVVASRRDSANSRRPYRRRSSSWRPVAAVVIVVLGLLVAAAAVQRAESAPRLEQEREDLIAQAVRLRESIATTQERTAAVSADVEALQGGSTAAAADPSALDPTQLMSQGVLSGAVPVTGPGLRIVVDDAPDAAKRAEGRVLDTDLQLLVNGLWQSGAEAIAINGHRLGPQSAIRVAGEAITVNYRSLSAPYTVQAIGDPATVQARFLSTDAGQAWLDLETNFDLRFRATEQAAVTLPAAPAPRLSHAEPQGDIP